MLDPITLDKISKSQGIDKFTILREYIQIVFLSNLYGQAAGKKLIFKGGTALRLLFGSPRFSEDLDFSTDLDIKETTKIVDKTILLCKHSSLSLLVKDLDSLAGVSKKIFFSSEISKQPLTIKLDFSQRENVISSTEKLIKTDLPIFSTSIISVLEPEEIIAEKYHALLCRDKGRDLYDVWFLLRSGYKFNPKLIQEKLEFFKKTYKLSELISKIENWQEDNIFEDINRFLPINERQILPKLKDLVLEEITTQ